MHAARRLGARPREKGEMAHARVSVARTAPARNDLRRQLLDRHGRIPLAADELCGDDGGSGGGNGDGGSSSSSSSSRHATGVRPDERSRRAT